METAGAAKARTFLDAFSRGDEQALRDLFTDDVALHVSGSNPGSGDHRGVDAVLAYLDRLRTESAGTYALAPESLLASDHHAAVVARATAQREGGRSLDVLVAHTFTVRSDGRWREHWICTNDQDAEDAFWS